MEDKIVGTGQHPVSRILTVGLMIALLSQLYLHAFVDHFRISAAVIALPVLLMTIGEPLRVMPLCGWTAGIVFLFRLLLSLPGGGDPVRVSLSLLPGAVFYLIYGALFGQLVRDRRVSSGLKMGLAVFCCDFSSNLLELLLRGVLQKEPPAASGFRILLIIALVRTLLVLSILALERYYRKYRLQCEREQRYRRLFLMVTGLKSELYLMNKNSDEIERVMRNAYSLSMEAAEQSLPESFRRMAFDIARDVHEIKKDYFRIIQGIEEHVDRAYDEERLRVREVMELLADTALGYIREQRLHISLEFHCKDDFVTREHYTLMMILKNLVINSMESIEEAERAGNIRVSEEKKGDCYLFSVWDDGPGIPLRSLDKIFRFGYSTKFDKKTGNIYRGVGLPGVRDLVENRFGGTMTVRSIPDVETVFLVSIPTGKLEMQEERKRDRTEQTESASGENGHLHHRR